MDLEYTRSAFKHGIAREDIEHAIRSSHRRLRQEYDGESRLLLLGPDRSGAYLEVILVPVDEPRRVIHADRLRPKLYDLLR